MVDRPVRPVRPSATAAAAAAQAKKLSGEDGSRISIRVTPATRKAVHRAAVLADKTVKRFVLELLRDASVDVDPEDLEEV
jgi:hypothetical protein